MFVSEPSHDVMAFEWLSLTTRHKYEWSGVPVLPSLLCFAVRVQGLCYPRCPLLLLESL